MKKAWYHKEFKLEEWLHKHLYFKDDSEFMIFLAWSIFVGVLFYAIAM